MATMVDLDKVKEIVKKHGKYIEGLFIELDTLAYGRIYKCIHCGRDIYFKDVSEYVKGCWLHIHNKAYLCDCSKPVGVSNIAIPIPDDMEDWRDKKAERK